MKFKKIVSLLAAVAMLFSIGITAMAEGNAPTEGYSLIIYNSDGTEGMTIDGTKSASEFCIKSAIEDARTFADNSFLFGLTTPCTYVVEMYEDSIESESFVIASDVTINGNGNKIVCAEGVEVTVTEGAKVNAEIVKTASDVTHVAKIGETTYATLQEAFMAATDGCTIEILSDVVIDSKWDCRDYVANGSHSQFKEAVTINGNGHTLKFTGAINDGNWNTIFKFEENATVNNLTIDVSAATGTQRVITAKKSLNVDKLTIVGAARYGIIFGEGASATDLAATEITITNSDLNGTRRAISDNEGGKDVKSVTITGNKLNANAYASASESITFTNNTAAGEVDLRSYTANNTLNVTATGNTLNTEKKNYIQAGGTVNAQEEFSVPARGTNSPAFTKEVDGYVRVWGQSENTNASKSFVLKLYSKETLIATTNLNNVGNILNGSQGSITWNFYYPVSNDEYWTTTWEKGHPNTLNKPTKVELYIDGTLVSTTDAQMNGADGINPVIWENLGGVMIPALPEAEVTNLGAIKVTDENGDGDYKFGTSYYEYDLINTKKLITATAPFDLNVAMQFVAKDEPEEAKANAYREYTTDFFIKIDGLKNGSFVGNGCYLAGYYPSFKAWVKIPLDGFTVEDGKVYPVISSAGFDFSYVDICTSVEDFICGIYLTPEILEANPDINVNLTLGLSESLEAAQKAEFEKVDDYTYTAEDFVTVELFDFYGSNIKLGNSLALNFAIDKTNINGTDYYAVIEHVTDSGIEKTTVPFAKWESDGNYYVIRYSGIVARQITDDINITIYNGDGTQVSAKYEDGLKKYAMRMIGKSSSEKLKTALVDMLNYGAAAQKEFGYKNNALANADLTDAQKSYASDMPTIVDKSEREPEKCVGSNLALVENIKMNMAFTGLKDDMYVVYEYTNHHGEKISKRVNCADLAVNNVVYRVLTIDTFVIADANQIVTATVYNADGTVYTVCKDSMNSYLARQLVKGDLESGLYSAIAKFTASSYNYLH